MRRTAVRNVGFQRSWGRDAVRRFTSQHWVVQRETERETQLETQPERELETDELETDVVIARDRSRQP